MNTITIGLIPSPGLPTKLIKKISDSVMQNISNNLDADVDWRYEIKTDPLISSAEYIKDVFTKSAQLKEENNWDYVVGITDLPYIYSKHVIVSELDIHKNIAFLSLPSLGFLNLKKKLSHILFQQIEVLHNNSPNKSASEYKNEKYYTPIILKEDDYIDIRYIYKSRLIGWLSLVFGMTTINEPWSVVTNFKTFVSLAFATGTYIAIFTGPWELSLEYEWWRFILLTILSMTGMIFWLIYAHQLWEKPSSTTDKKYRFLYNTTTFLTLLLITIVNYFFVFILLSFSISMFVPPSLFNDWTGAEPEINIFNFLNLVWFTTSLGILAGALGTTAEDEEKVRGVTYSYRQHYRYNSLQQEQDEYNKEV